MSSPLVSPIQHDFHHDKFDAINDSPRQREIRKIAPMSFGAVLIVLDHWTEEQIRWHLRTMKEVGLNSIKQFMPCPKWPVHVLEEMALEEGLVPWWYGEGGWEPITDELCEKLGIDPNAPIAEVRENPAMLAHQRTVLSKRYGRKKLKLTPEGQAGLHANKKGTVAGDLGVDADLPESAAPAFLEWLKDTYGDIQNLNKAWNMDVQRFISENGSEEFGFRSWEDVSHRYMTTKKEYRRTRDILRFKADLKNLEVKATADFGLERDKHEPHRSGGEMGLFLPFASRGTDMEGIASAMKDSGSFYPSIHLCWHFEETYFEVPRPVYMQASYVVDLNKGGWTAPWESTGGPQQTSGVNAPMFEWVRDEQPGYTVDAGVMTQLLYSYLAAGCKGAGLWAWNTRQAGWEGGEYGLLDRNEKVCDRTIRVGNISKACQTYRDEIWAAHKEPQVGIMLDWDNDALWAALSNFGRRVFKHFPMEARVGASRACIDANVPYEYVTPSNLKEGLAQRYPVIFLTGTLGFNTEIMAELTEYVKQGGRLVMDMPGGGYDQFGRLLRTPAGSDFEQLFGVELSDLQYSGNNVVWEVADEPAFGYTAELIPTTAKVIDTYDNGLPSITENALGEGTAVILGWEAGRAAYLPGNDEWQDLLITHLLGDTDPQFEVEGAPWTFRISAPAADHYFLINEGPAETATFKRVPFAYGECIDVLSGEPIDLAQALPVGKDDGLWIRCAK